MAKRTTVDKERPVKAKKRGGGEPRWCPACEYNPCRCPWDYDKSSLQRRRL